MLAASSLVGCAGKVTSGNSGNPTTASITGQPVNQSVSMGQSATFAVTADGTAPLLYQWRKNAANIANAVSASYTTPPTAAADNGARYDVVVSNSVGTVTSVAATLAVSSTATTAPKITTQPVNQTVTLGQAATFTVVAAGTPAPAYQWQKNGVNISGATSTSYSTPATVAGDTGSKFDVVVTNSAGSVTSASATLTVSSTATTKPNITTQPANQAVTLGQSATFTVIATGTPAPTYQWQKNGANISGATSASYSTPPTVAGDTGSTFDVVVTNSAGSVTSASATLTVSAVAPPSGVDVTTYHYDNLRTGQNLNETVLTPANVNQTKFAKLGSFNVDGHVDAQPLYLSNLAIPDKGTKNVLYVVTEHDTVYAFDADSVSGNSSTILWQHSVLASGETSSDDRGCGQVTPEIGITSTPVIDRARNAIYLIAVSKTSGSDVHPPHSRARPHHRRGTLRRPNHDCRKLPRYRRKQLRRKGGVRSAAIQRAARPAANRRHDLHHVGLALRCWSLHLVGDVLQRRHSRSRSAS